MRFNGKDYRYHSLSSHKREIEKRKKELMAAGYKVRIAKKVGYTYYIYIRK